VTDPEKDGLGAVPLDHEAERTLHSQVAAHHLVDVTIALAWDGHCCTVPCHLRTVTLVAERHLVVDRMDELADLQPAIHKQSSLDINIVT
jgi:hypothetical protein